MTRDERLDLLVDKIKRGVIAAHRQFLIVAAKENRKLVVMRDGKIVTIPARKILKEQNGERKRRSEKSKSR